MIEIENTLKKTPTGKYLQVAYCFKMPISTKLRESYNILYFDYFIIVVPDKITITKQLKTSTEPNNHKIIYLKSL